MPNETKKDLARHRQLSFGLLSQRIYELETWSYEQAKEADYAWKQSKGGFPSPSSQWSIWHLELPRLGKRYFDEGDRFALLEAVDRCARFRLPLPAWCTREFGTAIAKIERFESRSLDQAFGSPYPKGTRIHDQKRAFTHRIPAVLEVCNIIERDPETTLDDALGFVAERYPIGKKLLERWYYEYVNSVVSVENFEHTGKPERNTGRPEEQA